MKTQFNRASRASVMMALMQLLFSFIHDRLDRNYCITLPIFIYFGRVSLNRPPLSLFSIISKGVEMTN